MQAKLQSCNNTIYWLPNDQVLNFDMERAEGEVHVKYSVHRAFTILSNSFTILSNSFFRCLITNQIVFNICFSAES
jgi:hypothetical protein